MCLAAAGTATTPAIALQDALMTVAYLVSGILFILSLRGLSSQETAGAGNTYGIVGMSIAIGATLCLATTNRIDMGYMGYLAPALVIAVAIGWMMAARVAMTAMPELVALLHSLLALLPYWSVLPPTSTRVVRTTVPCSSGKSLSISLSVPSPSPGPSSHS